MAWEPADRVGSRPEVPPKMGLNPRYPGPPLLFAFLLSLSLELLGGRAGVSPALVNPQRIRLHQRMLVERSK